MFHLVAYTGAANASGTDFDMAAATDPSISQRNGHYTFTSQFQLLAAAFFSTGATRANIQSPTLESITRFNVWPVNTQLTVPSPPRIMALMQFPIQLPQYEEIQFVGSGNISIQQMGFLWLGDQNWNLNIPRGVAPVPQFCARFTASIVTTANAWSALAALTLEHGLRNGTYSVVGAEFQGTNLVAARLYFPRQTLYDGKILRPGILAQNAIGDIPAFNFPDNETGFGEWGRFSTYEPPQIDGWAQSAATITVEGRLWLVRVADTQMA